MKEKDKNNVWISPDFIPGLFSLIVPVYNRDDVIEETLESAKNQTYKNIELLIVDDGSSDDSANVINSWLELNADRFVNATYTYQENAGVCAARNNALSASKGEFIQFLDSDDLIHAERLELCAKSFSNPEIEYIETGFEGFVTENGRKEIISTSLGHHRSNHLMLLCKGRLLPNTLRPAYRRSMINKIGPWNTTMVTFQDYEFVIRGLTQIPQSSIAVIPEVLASARRDTGGRMSDIFLTHEGRRLRIYCEKILVDHCIRNKKIPVDWKRMLKSRLYSLAFRTKAEGYDDLFADILEKADSIKVSLDLKGRLRRVICLLPVWAINYYIKIGELKSKVTA